MSSSRALLLPLRNKCCCSCESIRSVTADLAGKPYPQSLLIILSLDHAYWTGLLGFQPRMIQSSERFRGGSELWIAEFVTIDMNSEHRIDSSELSYPSSEGGVTTIGS